MVLKRYTTEEFLNLLDSKVKEAGSVTALANNWDIKPPEISYARSYITGNGTRPPSARLLKHLGLRTEVNYVSIEDTGESNEEDT